VYHFGSLSIRNRTRVYSELDHLEGSKGTSGSWLSSDVDLSCREMTISEDSGYKPAFQHLQTGSPHPKFNPSG
jgi:hypothetical protein